jgi:hypothetical protein
MLVRLRYPYKARQERRESGQKGSEYTSKAAAARGGSAMRYRIKFADGIVLVADIQMCLPDGWGLARLQSLDRAILVNRELEEHPPPPDCDDPNWWVAQTTVRLFPKLHGVIVIDDG